MTSSIIELLPLTCLGNVERFHCDASSLWVRLSH